MINSKKITPTGYFLITILFISLFYSSWLFYQSIDWQVLDRLEKAPLILPSPIPSPID